MKKVIQFTKVRYAMITLSVILILGGVGSFFARGGFNLGIDFTGGLNKQFQIAQTAFSLSYNGAGRAEVFIVGKKLEIAFSGTEQPGTKTFSFAAYPSLSRLVDALMEIPGMNAELVGNPETPPASILSLNFPIDITGARLVVNHGLDPESEIYASIHKVREALSALGSFSIQLVGNPINQEFILKVPTPRDVDKEFLQRIDSQIEGLLADAFGKDQIISKKTDFVDPVFSIDLVRGAIWSIVVALVLILIYVSFRFKLSYATGAILALVHDVSIMIGVIAAVQLEITSATIAAVLTIIGYSLNDTIVVFDRIRENTALMPEAGRENIINTSITQSLSRTTITSLTTLLAVLAIYIFGTGMIQDFAFALIIGIVVGTYSSIFIAAPIVLGWQNAAERRKRAWEEKKLGRAPLRVVKPSQADDKPEKVPQAEAAEAAFKLVPQERKYPLKKKKKKKRR